MPFILKKDYEEVENIDQLSVYVNNILISIHWLYTDHNK